MCDSGGRLPGAYREICDPDGRLPGDVRPLRQA
jgi:hypothetical protein